MDSMHEIEFRWTEIDPDLFGYLNEEAPLEFSVASMRIAYKPSHPDGSAFVLTTSRTVSTVARDALLEWEARETELNVPFADDQSFTDDIDRLMRLTEDQETASGEVLGAFEQIIRTFEEVVSRLSSWVTWRDHILPDSDIAPRDWTGPGERKITVEYRLPPNTIWRELPERPAPPAIAKGAPYDEIGGGATGRNHFLSDLQNESNEAPLAWSLFRNAVRVSSDRHLSTVLAVAAAEVAVKRFLVADGAHGLTEWLLLEQQAPSWSKLTRKALPLVTDRRVAANPNWVIPRTSIYEPIERGIRARDSYVHSGEMQLDEKDYLLLMSAVNDLIYALEWMRGSDWAFKYISERSRGAWQGPASDG